MPASAAWTSPPASAARTSRAALRAGLAALAFALLPKCPACIAVYLGAIGVGASVAAPVATGLRGAVLLLALAAALAAVRRALRHAR